MKLTLEQKIQIYNEWKLGHRSLELIAKKNKICRPLVSYMVHLADRYGADILGHGKNHHYPPEFKKEAVNRVLIYHESANQVSLDLVVSLTMGLSHDG